MACLKAVSLRDCRKPTKILTKANDPAEITKE